jgi:uncharacterized iron-regulated membrane protein
MKGTALYPTIWRWHFYAGLFVLPFILILSITGSIYLFKPQIEQWEEQSYNGLRTTGAVSADRQLAVVMAVNPDARFNHYRLPRETGDAAMIQLGLPSGALREVYVSPQGRLLGSLDPDARIAAVVARIHGSLLIGRWGDWLVELVASWTIVMILTGLYLWWPRPLRLAGTLWPRPSLRGRPLLKDIHRVTGFWVAGLVLVMLASGLPWAGAWGSAFAWTRAELGLVKGPQDWEIGVDGGHAGHDHGMTRPGAPVTASPGGLPLSVFVRRAEAERMAFPVLVLPPHAPQAFGPPTGDVWTVKSVAQNRTLTRQATFDPPTGREVSRSGFSDQHIIDRIVNTGVAWHEGQLFGLVNQIIGVLTALALTGISVLGVLMWLRRRTPRTFGAPVASTGKGLGWVALPLIALCIMLPLFGVSVIVILLAEQVVAAIAKRRNVISGNR